MVLPANETVVLLSHRHVGHYAEIENCIEETDHGDDELLVSQLGFSRLQTPAYRVSQRAAVSPCGAGCTETVLQPLRGPVVPVDTGGTI